MSAIEAVIFDYGGVLSSSPFEDMAKTAGMLNLDPGTFIELVIGNYGVDADQPMHRLERGELTLARWKELLKARADSMGLSLDLSKMKEHFFEYPTPNAGMFEIARSIKNSGYRTAILSNSFREMDDWRNPAAFGELFDTVVVSWEVGMRKPNPAIYQIALDRLGVAPGQAVFLDDHPANVAAAASLGIHSIHVKDHDGAISHLKSLIDGEA